MNCPAWDRLRRLGEDAPDDPDFSAIEAHVEQCADCQEALDRLVRDDPDETGRAAPEDRGPWPEVPGFSIVRELGRGGSGVVFEAIREPIGRRVALKVLDDRPGRGPSAHRRWLREVRALGSVRHPAIVRLYDAGEHSGRPFLVLDLIEGGSVQDRLDGPIAPRVAAELIARIARAVAELHRRGIRHLDVKPSNILLDGLGAAGWSSPLLADFGIACLDDETVSLATGSWGPRGTPAYMAPEQVSHHRAAVGPSADIFSLGATLYALLTGGPPFPAATVLEMFDALRQREPVRPSAIVAGVPRDLETICLTCLNKQPADRYPSAEALADDLERWLDGRPIQARRASPREIAWRWSRRHPLSASLAASLALALIVGLIAVTLLWRNAERQRQAAQAALDRAIAGESTAGRAISILTALVRSAVESPEQLAKERTGSLLPGILGLTETVRGSPEVLADQIGPIAALELELAGLLDRQTNFEAMRTLLDDGIQLLETVPRLSQSVDDQRTLASLRLYRALLSHREGREAEAIADTRAAIEVLAAHVDEAGWDESLINLDGMVEGLTSAPHADDSPAGRLARLYRERIRPEAFRPKWAVRAAWGWTRTEPIEAIFQQVGPLDRIPPTWSFALTDGIAGELANWGEGDEAAGMDQPSLGERSLRDLQSWDRRLGQPALSEALLERIGQQGMTRGYAHRQADRRDQARRMVRWMKGLAESLAIADPDRPGLHLLASRALDEQARLDDQIGRREEAEAAWREALREASIAREAAPEDPETRRHLAELRERYFRAIVKPP